MRARLRALRLLGASAVVALAACHGEEKRTGGVAVMQAPESPDATTAEVWVALARDPAPCPAAPDCGWLLHPLNLHEDDVHFDGIDLSAAGLGEGDRAAVLDAPDGAVVLEGVEQGSTFVVRRAFRALPVDGAPAVEEFVQVEQGPDTKRVVQLNVGLDVTMPAVDLSAAEVPHLDHAWLASRVFERGAILGGTFTGVPGGRGIARFEATRVFVPLPDRVAACPSPTARPCPPWAVESSARDADRCAVRLGCRVPTRCFVPPPDCTPGYTLRTWRASTGACPDFACDPTFLPE
jgi:hypothetical protein